MSPNDRVIEYAQFAGQFEQISDINSYGRKLNFIQFHSLDIYIPIIIIILLFIFIIVKFILLVYRKIVLMMTRSAKIEMNGKKTD
jgi:hypothetical protein